MIKALKSRFFRPKIEEYTNTRFKMTKNSLKPIMYQVENSNGDKTWYSSIYYYKEDDIVMRLSDNKVVG